MIANQPYGTPPFLLNAMASSGLTVTFVSSTPQVCQVSGATVTLLSVGTCSIAAFQPGNANFTAAPPAAQSFMVIQASQAITFGALSTRRSDPAVALGASASSGLPVASPLLPPRFVRLPEPS